MKEIELGLSLCVCVRVRVIFNKSGLLIHSNCCVRVPVWTLCAFGIRGRSTKSVSLVALLLQDLTKLWQATET